MRILLNRVVLLLCLCAVVLPVFAQSPQSSTSQSVSAVEESARLNLLEKSSLFSIELSSNSPVPRGARLSATIVSHDGKTLASASSAVRLTAQPRRFELSLNWAPSKGLEDVSTTRLFYEVQFDGDSAPALSGILSPLKLVPELFILYFTGMEALSPGSTYLAYVRAVHPGTNKPVAGVALTGSLGDDDDAKTPKSLRPTARTNAQGEAVLKFRLPDSTAASDNYQLDLQIDGARGHFQDFLTSSVMLWRRAAIVLSSDKPLYQPEQTLHMRALVIADSRRAWPKQALRFEIKDPEDTVVFSADTTTSRFGIASADWPIPASQKLGFYRLTAQVSTDANSRELQLSQNIRISRYELPTFTVNTQTDKTFYLRERNANLTVSASYLFGKPVLRGHVRVLRENSRKWNYHDQKWDAEEDLIGEGELDEKNEFRASLDLKKDQTEFEDQDWKRFEDLRFAAYLTDASSGRTQERHFDVRITHEPIHLYVLNGVSPFLPGLPSTLYLSCDFADGSPAPADIKVQAYAQDPSDPNIAQDANRPLASSSARAGKYGIARITIPVLPQIEPDKNQRLYLAFEAQAPDGRVGKHLESYSQEIERAFRIKATKVVLNPGDPIVARIESSVSKGRIRVAVASGDTQSILASRELKLSPGSTQVAFTPDDHFVGKLSLVAYDPDVTNTGYSANMTQASVASVVFPAPSTLKLDVTPVKKSYRPGDSAAVRLQVRDTQNAATEGALGFLVYDQALEELVRTEASLSTGGYERIDANLGFQNPLEESSGVAGITEKDLLNRLSGSSVSTDLELAAEALYASQDYAPIRFESSDEPRDFRTLFSAEIYRVLNPAGTPIQEFFHQTGHFPADESAYASVLKKAGLDPARVLDPWGRAYRIRRSLIGSNDVFEFLSDGPDKTPGTADDFTAYDVRRPFFENDGARLGSAVSGYQNRTGNFIRDDGTLKSALDEQHALLSSFVDPWGTPYRFTFGIDRDNFIISVSSAGPDKKFRTEKPRENFSDDDLVVSIIRSPYFLELTKRIEQALFDNAKAALKFPDNAEEFQAALLQHGIDWNSLRDPWGHPYRVETSIKYDYSDKITVRAYGDNAAASTSPATRTLKMLNVWSDGPDGAPNSHDDFVLAHFLSPIREETGGTNAAAAAPQKPPVFYSGGSGAIRVEVKDQTGAVISNAKVTATNQTTGIAYAATANEQGICLVINLPAGIYRLLVESTGFRSYALTSVPVFSSNATNVEVTLSVGATMETVEVTAEAVQLQTTSSEVSVMGRRVDGLALVTKSGAAKGQINIPVATPRLREYFPETLLWRPEVLTDRAGQATVKFPLADSITTWKVSVIASTLDGRVATASADLRAFQPFFAELDPPKILTVGDEIHLPVTVRNYLDKPQSVSLDWSAEPWSQTLSSRTAELSVPAGDYSQNIFAFRAALPLKNALQRVTAINRSSKNESDAIERKLRVHPDGQEQLRQSSSIFSAAATLSLDVPAGALPGSVEAELVVYPNLFSHLSDAIEGIMQRPYGCAEQTISSAYPSLLWLQLQKSQKLPASALDARARHYLNLAYTKLIGYRDASGGFSYWGKGDPYVPLTAYALRFLTEASEFVAVDPDVIAGTRRWLLQQASPDGTWGWKTSDKQSSEWAKEHYTAYVVQVLARDLLRPDSIDKKDLETERKLVTSGITYLSKSVAATAEPYRIALLALAKLSIKQDASSEIARLLAQKHTESETAYWNLEQNTLFYGWGLAGRLETTALVLEALSSAKQQGNTDPAVESALTLGTHFLLKNKDRYHVWYSTQATVNVLQCLVRQLAQDSSDPISGNAPALVIVDGKPGPSFPAVTDSRQLTPLRVDLSSYLSPGIHRVEIRGDSFRHAVAYLNASYYLPWKDPSVVQSFVPSGDSESIRYSVKFDRTSVSVGGQILCTVHAERVGFRGYGMMLAEVGLPPGADVDRASLDAAVAGDWYVQSYEVQPDRVVLYLWPSAGGTTFSFKLKPRFAMNAQSAESILYDYYNPLARASVEPVRFTVQ